MSKPSDDTATLARTRVDGAWLYTDPKTQSFCLSALFAGFNLADFDDWLSALEPCVAKDELMLRRARTIDLYGTGQPEAVRVNLEWMALRRHGIMREEFVLPLAKKGAKFPPMGRGKGPIRKAITKLLTRDPTLENDALWDAIKARPPKGWIVYENARLGKYIEGPTPGDNMKHSTFKTRCSEVRKEIKK